MNTETYTAGQALRAGEVTLIPVARSCINSYTPNEEPNMSYWLSGKKEPFAIIVCDTKGVRAFDMASTEITLDSLRDILPDLNTLLSPYC